MKQEWIRLLEDLTDPYSYPDIYEHMRKTLYEIRDYLQTIEVAILAQRKEGWGWGYFNGYKDGASEKPYSEHASEEGERLGIFE